MSFEANLRNHKRLAELLQEIIDYIEVPESNCSCHINPPCNDCTNHSWIREQIHDANVTLKAFRELPPIIVKNIQHKDFENMHLTPVKSIQWPNTEYEQGARIVANEKTKLTFKHEYLGDHEEVWIEESEDGAIKALHNPRYLESIVFF